MDQDEDVEHAKWAEVNNLTRASIYDFGERITGSRSQYTHEYIFDFSDMFYQLVSINAPEE